jgi:hypothetical protein
MQLLRHLYIKPPFLYCEEKMNRAEERKEEERKKEEKEIVKEEKEREAGHGARKKERNRGLRRRSSPAMPASIHCTATISLSPQRRRCSRAAFKP